MDDEELDAYIIGDEGEVNQRQLEWNILNKEYLKMMDEKESLKRAQTDDDPKSASNPKSVCENYCIFFWQPNVCLFLP